MPILYPCRIVAASYNRKQTLWIYLRVKLLVVYLLFFLIMLSLLRTNQIVLGAKLTSLGLQRLLAFGVNHLFVAIEIIAVDLFHLALGLPIVPYILHSLPLLHLTSSLLALRTSNKVSGQHPFDAVTLAALFLAFEDVVILYLNMVFIKYQVTTNTLKV